MFLFICIPQGCRYAPNPGLELANAFGVSQTEPVLFCAFGGLSVSTHVGGDLLTLPDVFIWPHLRRGRSRSIMEKKHYSVDQTGEDPDGTIPFTGLPAALKGRQSEQRSDNHRRNADFDLTTPNIPISQVDLSIPPAPANHNFDLTEMKIRAVDVDEDARNIISRPHPQKTH